MNQEFPVDGGADEKLAYLASRISETSVKSVICLELEGNGLISIRSWKDGRPDSIYPAQPLEYVLREISVLVQELQQPDPLSSPIDAQADGFLVKVPFGPAPTVREMISAVGVFSQAICASEAYARAGRGGFVRIEAMAPVMAAIKQYMDLLPATSIER